MLLFSLLFLSMLFFILGYRRRKEENEKDFLEMLNHENLKSKRTGFSLIGYWQQKASTAGLDLNRKELIFLIVIPLVFGGFLGYLFLSSLLGVIIGSLLGSLFPTLYIRWKAGKNRRLFYKDFPLALSVGSAITGAGGNLEDWIAEVSGNKGGTQIEFKRALQQIRYYKLSPIQVLEQMAQRLQIIELEMFVSALKTGKKEGGNLIALFSDMEEIVKRNMRFHRKIVSSTRMYRNTGVVMALTFLLVAIFFLPTIQNIVHDNAFLQIMLYFAMIWFSFGIYMLFRIMRVEL